MRFSQCKGGPLHILHTAPGGIITFDHNMVNSFVISETADDTKIIVLLQLNFMNIVNFLDFKKLINLN